MPVFAAIQLFSQSSAAHKAILAAILASLARQVSEGVIPPPALSSVPCRASQAADRRWSRQCRACRSCTVPRLRTGKRSARPAARGTVPLLRLGSMVCDAMRCFEYKVPHRVIVSGRFVVFHDATPDSESKMPRRVSKLYDCHPSAAGRLFQT